ncbi:MAG: OmpA family protein [Burkholderiales bacterium]|nr:OmpA family protein [Burkholderiales bacterium]
MTPTSLAFRLILAAALLVAARVHAQPADTPPASNPSVQEMVDALKPKPALGRSRSLAPGQPAPPPQPGKLELSVQFEFNSAKVSLASVDLLKKLAAAMKAPELVAGKFMIEGHTDAVGTAAYNKDLSERRAASVKQILVGEGIDTARLTTAGKGATELIDKDDPKAAVNRRVRVVGIMEGDAAVATTKAATEPAAKAPPHVAGKVTRLVGEARIGRNRDGKAVEVVLKDDDVVNAGDTISTGPTASVVVGMNDGARVLVRPGTTVTIAESIASGPLGKLVQKLELLVGAVRFITGDIGKRNPDGVRLKTPTLTIGIRGTDIELVHAPRTRSGAPGGSFVKVNSGAVALTGLDGSNVDLAAGEQGSAALAPPKLRGGGTAPATRKGDVPADIFAPQDGDAALLDMKR